MDHVFLLWSGFDIDVGQLFQKKLFYISLDACVCTTSEKMNVVYLVINSIK